MIKNRRAIVLAHFDRDGLLDPHVRATLASLAATGAEILVVSTNLSQTETLTGTGVHRVIRRDNAGYDFRSWQIGLRALGDLNRYQEIVLMNDSFYIMREDALVAALDALRRLSYDVGSLTASREFCYHLQSYFMVFRPTAFLTPWFERFWDDVSPDSDRAAAIRRYELPLALQARSAGLRVGALQTAPLLPSLPYLAERWSIRARDAGWRAGIQAVIDAFRGLPGMNPTLHGWVSTATRCSVIKVELLRENPCGADLSKLDALMEPACLARARRHIARICRSAALVGSAA